MNEEKLDLILAAVTEIKGDVNHLGSRMDKLDSRMDKLDSRMDKLDSRMDTLEKGFVDFKNYVTKSFESMNNRINLLEKQMSAMGFELKNEIKNVREDIDRLENKIMLEQAEKIQDRVKVRQLEARVTKLEEQVRLAA